MRIMCYCLGLDLIKQGKFDESADLMVAESNAIENIIRHDCRFSMGDVGPSIYSDYEIPFWNDWEYYYVWKHYINYIPSGLIKYYQDNEEPYYD